MKVNPRVSALEEELRKTKEALTFSRDLMTDLLLEIGSRESCARCGRPAVWVWSKDGNGLLLNVDGSQHWPRCAARGT